MLLKVAGFLTFALAFILSSCAPEQSNIVAEFGNQKITLNEFKTAYAKNAGSLESSKKDSLNRLKNFLNLYVDFKMKLRDAEVRGYDSDPELQNELEDYEKKIGVTYLLDKRLVLPAIKKLYEKRKWELRISHLMIIPDSTGEEAAKERAQTLLDSIKNGGNFEELVKKYSMDNYSKNNGGDIFYFTAGQLPIEFEDAAYETPVGQIYPHVVRTRYGFHIIKVTDKRERIPQIRASHILASFRNHEGKIDSAAAKAKINSAAAKLKAGEKFADVAKELSDDTGSRQQGGDLGYFSRRMMVKPFDEAAFNLKVGRISDIVTTPFGYHIIKVTGQKPYPSFDEDREELKKIYKKMRYQSDYNALIDSLRNAYSYKLNKPTLDSLVKQCDTLKVGMANVQINNLKKHEIFSFTGVSENVGNFYKAMNDQNEFQNKLMTADLIKHAVESISANMLLDNAALNLVNTDKQFAALMQDYKNGIYIFKLQEDEIWSKIKVDSAKLYNYYLSTKDKYVWPDRVKYDEIFSRNDSIIGYIYTQLKEGVSFDSLASKYNEKISSKGNNGSEKLQDVNSSELAAKAYELKNPGDYTLPIAVPGGHSIVKLVEKLPSSLKTFDEAKAEVASAFQDFESKRLETSYLKSLKNRYKPEIFYNELAKTFNKQE